MKSFQIVGAKELVKNINALKDAWSAARLEEASHEGAELVRSDASSKAPRRTGDLANSIVKQTLTGEKKADSVQVGIGPTKNVWYGIFPEIGTRFKAATPYLRPALDEQTEQIINAISAVLKQDLVQVSKQVKDFGALTTKGHQRKV